MGSSDGNAASQLPCQKPDCSSKFVPAAGTGAADRVLGNGLDDLPRAPEFRVIASRSPTQGIGAVPSPAGGNSLPVEVTIESLAVEVQGVRQQFGDVHRVAELFSGVPSAVLAFEQQLREEDTAFSPRRWLCAVMGVEEFALSCSLHSTLRGKLLDRLQARPAAASRSRDPSTVKVEVDCTYRALQQLARCRQLSLSGCVLRQCRASCAVQLPSPRAELDALEVPSHMVSTVLLRCFSRQNGDKVTRLLLENHVTPDGTVFYVLGRIAENRNVSGVVHQSEDMHILRGQHRHPLQKRTVPVGDVFDLPAHPQCRVLWKANMTSASLEADAAMVRGRLCLTVPSTVVVGDGSELSSFLF